MLWRAASCSKDICLQRTDERTSSSAGAAPEADRQARCTAALACTSMSVVRWLRLPDSTSSACQDDAGTGSGSWQISTGQPALPEGANNWPEPFGFQQQRTSPLSRARCHTRGSSCASRSTRSMTNCACTQALSLVAAGSAGRQRLICLYSLGLVKHATDHEQSWTTAEERAQLTRWCLQTLPFAWSGQEHEGWRPTFTVYTEPAV